MTDYDGIDVKGKIVIIERGIPYRDKDEKKRFDLYMRYASESYKLPQALKKGAARCCWLENWHTRESLFRKE